MARPILREPGSARPWEIVPISPAQLAAARSMTELPPAETPEDLLAAAQRQADEILRSAQGRADLLLQRAREESEQLRADAYRAGLQDGMALGADEWGEKKRHLHDLCRAVRAGFEEFCEAQVPALASVAADAAGRVLVEQLTLEPQRIVALVRQSLERMTASSEITVRLHPDDLDLVHRDPALRNRGSLMDVRFVDDPEIERGGCLLEGAQGELDATVSTRLNAIHEILAESDAG